MTSHLPIQLHDGTAAFVSRFHTMAGNDKVARDSIQAVIRTFAPKESPAGRDRQTLGKQETQRRLQTDGVVWSQYLRASRVCAALEQRIERLEVGVGCILIPAREIGCQPDARTPAHA